MTDKHTPGPWRTHVVRFSHRTMRTIKAGADWIAHLDTVSADGDDPRDVANARLIEAAPDMLAALERAADELDSIMDWHGIGHPAVLRDARAAIAKARGDQ